MFAARVDISSDEREKCCILASKFAFLFSRSARVWNKIVQMSFDKVKMDFVLFGSQMRSCFELLQDFKWQRVSLPLCFTFAT